MSQSYRSLNGILYKMYSFTLSELVTDKQRTQDKCDDKLLLHCLCTNYVAESNNVWWFWLFLLMSAKDANFGYKMAHTGVKAKVWKLYFWLNYSKTFNKRFARSKRHIRNLSYNQYGQRHGHLWFLSNLPPSHKQVHGFLCIICHFKAFLDVSCISL